MASSNGSRNDKEHDQLQNISQPESTLFLFNVIARQFLNTFSRKICLF